MMVAIRPAEIQFNEAATLGVLDRRPEEHLHSAQRVRRGVGAPVLVNERVLEIEGEDTGYGARPFQRDMNRQSVAEQAGEVAEPIERLWRENLSAACHHEEPVELSEEIVRPARLICQMLALCSADFALHAVFVEAVIQEFERRAQIYSMEDELSASAESRRKIGDVRRWSEFDVLPPPARLFGSQKPEYLSERVRVFDQRRRMIRKRKRYQPRAGEPTADDAGDDDVPQLCIRRRGRIRNGLIAVRES
jgi:hypothetical protein